MDARAAATVRAWNLMGGTIDWAGLPVVAQVVGMDDLELLAEGLAQIRAQMSHDDAGQN